MQFFVRTIDFFSISLNVNQLLRPRKVLCYESPNPFANSSPMLLHGSRSDPIGEADEKNAKSKGKGFGLDALSVYARLFVSGPTLCFSFRKNPLKGSQRQAEKPGAWVVLRDDLSGTLDSVGFTRKGKPKKKENEKWKTK